MPILEFHCPTCNETFENFDALTFKAAENVKSKPCPKCHHRSPLVTSLPSPAQFFGNPDGWSKPSPRKRYSTKLASKEGHSNKRKMA